LDTLLCRLFVAFIAIVPVENLEGVVHDKLDRHRRPGIRLEQQRFDLPLGHEGKGEGHEAHLVLEGDLLFSFSY